MFIFSFIVGIICIALIVVSITVQDSRLFFMPIVCMLLWFVVALLATNSTERVSRPIDKCAVIEYPNKVVIIDSTGYIQNFYDLKSFNAIKAGDTLYYMVKENIFGLKLESCLTFEKK